jgi:hypothetical protein
MPPLKKTIDEYKITADVIVIDEHILTQNALKKSKQFCEM